MNYLFKLLIYVFILLIIGLFVPANYKISSYGKPYIIIGWLFWTSATSLFLMVNIISGFLRNKEARILLREKNPSKEHLIQYFNAIAKSKQNWREKNNAYYKELQRIFEFLIPSNASVIEIGCGTGATLSELKRPKRTGIDFSPEMIAIAKQQSKDIEFHTLDAENLPSKKLGTYDTIILSDILSHTPDIQLCLEETAKISHDGTRIIITCYNFLWEPLLFLMEKLYIKMPQFRQNWISMSDLENFIELSNMEVVKKARACILPLDIPLLSWLFNRILVRLPFFRHFGLIQYLVVRKKNLPKKDYSISIVIPARNEAGNIEQAILRTPKIGSFTEIIFVEGNSTDNTWDEIQRVYKKYKGTHKLKIMKQPGKGKGDAVRHAFQYATGDIVTILDADLTMPPEDLPKFYNVMARRQAEFVNGSRLVYSMEEEAMRFFNVIGNKFFSLAFTWLLGQPLKDTLCGTKMLFKKDYENIAANRNYFGDFDPFGDFDLLFGASKMNLKILEMPIRYRSRVYGETNINRWSHGFLLLRMVVFASRKIKFY